MKSRSRNRGRRWWYIRVDAQTPSFCFNSRKSWELRFAQSLAMRFISRFPSLRAEVSVCEWNGNGGSTCLSLFSHSVLVNPPSLQPAISAFSSTFSSASFDTSFFRLQLAQPEPQPPSLSSLLTTRVLEGAHRSFSISDSQTAATVLFGTKGKVVSGRGMRSGVMTSKLRHIGQSTDSCHAPQWKCSREKNHLRIHRAQKVCPH